MLPNFIKQRIRRFCGRSLQVFGYSTGLMELTARLWQVDGAIILMYHSVADDHLSKWIDPANHVPADVFAKQMEFLSRRRSVVSLDKLVFSLQQGKALTPGTVVITFDDGYLDNLTIAAPTLEHYGLTATVFLPTGYIDRGETQWIDQFYSVFKFRTRNRLTWIEGSYEKLNLDKPTQFQAVYEAICQSFIKASYDQRRDWLNELRNQLQPSAHPPRLTMTWDEVRTLVSKYHCFEIGAHTLDHTDFTSVSEEIIKKELTDCSQRIKAEIDLQPRYFSFCYGRTSESLRRMVAEAGFEAACGGQGLDPVINAPADPMRLPRIAGPPIMHRFDLVTNTANTGIWRRLGRRES